VVAFTAFDNFTMDSERCLGKSLLGIKTSSQSTNFIQLKNVILGLKKLNSEMNKTCSKCSKLIKARKQAGIA
jgi:hypothetical protein